MSIAAAVKKGSPVQVAMIRTSGTMLSFVLQTQSDEEPSSIFSILGAVIISATAVMMTMETRISKSLKSCCSKKESTMSNEQWNLVKSEKTLL